MNIELKKKIKNAIFDFFFLLLMILLCFVQLVAIIFMFPLVYLINNGTAKETWWVLNDTLDVIVKALSLGF